VGTLVCSARSGAIAFPFVFLTLHWVYLLALSTRFLELLDLATDQISWPCECRAQRSALGSSYRMTSSAMTSNRTGWQLAGYL
jgi:hypothetical protein